MSRLVRRLNYYRRVFAAYLTPWPSQLTFWHERPELNERAAVGWLGEYFMMFQAKADYPGPFDERGVPLLDYRGVIGRQYNPIAVAQYGLGNYNLAVRTGDPARFARCRIAADWLVARLEPNEEGVPVWYHDFDWEYRTTLKAPWYSGLAQGQGVSLLVRAYQHFGERRYLDAAHDAFRSFLKPIEQGGVVHRDAAGDAWFEEYIVDPPTHILNGFIWASWGVYDYTLLTKDPVADRLFASAIETLKKNIHRYDTGYWSLYEHSNTRMRMLASPFYHRLHIVQLGILYRLTGEEIFERYAKRWEGYTSSAVNRSRALVQKAAFKFVHY